MSRGFLLLCLLPVSAFAGATPDATPGDIGLERTPARITLSRGDYAVVPQDDAAPVLLLVESVTPEKSGGFTYAFRSLGFEAGEYRLADYLVHPDGTPAVELGDRSLKVSGLLLPDHNGALNAFSPTPTPGFGGYRTALFAVIALWVVALPALVFIGRKRKVVAAVAPVVPVPSRAERMRPFVLAAAEGRLDASGRAELERLMTGHWRETLGLPDERMGDIFAAMRRHSDAGPLLKALERWLHDPRGATPGEIDTLLAPYAGKPDESTNGSRS